MANISIDQLAAEIANAVRDYTEEVSEAIAEKVDEVADAVLMDVSANAPKRTGDYAKGFRKTKRDTPGTTRRFIWNKKYSRLVHLLEFGHAKRSGGRISGRPHLRPAYDAHAERLQDDIRRIIRNGGGS